MARKAKKQWDGVYQRKDRPGWWGSWKDAQGRRRTRKFNVYTLQQAQTALKAEKHKVEEAIRFGKPLPTEDSFTQFAKQFLKYQERRVSPVVVKGKISRTEYNRQKGIVERHLTPFFGDMKLAAIRRADVIRYLHSRMGEVGDGTIIKECNTLKRLFNVAIELDKIGANPAHKAPLPKAPEGRVRWLTNDELHKVLRACYIPPDENGNEQEQWLQHAAGLAVALGARRGELLNVNVPDINLDTRTIVLRRTKNGKARQAFINDLAMQVLVAMQVVERKKKRDRGPLLTGFTPEQLSMRFIRACRDAGVEDFSLHDLRHCYASHLRMAGADLHDLKELLGHSDLRMTVRYAHLSQAHLSAAAARLDGVLTLPGQSVAADTTGIRRIRLGALRLDFQPSENLIEETVLEKVQQIRDGLPLKPIAVRFDGESYFLYDGFHRVEAARRCGLLELDAEVSPGNLQDMENEFRAMLGAIKRDLRTIAKRPASVDNRPPRSAAKHRK